MSTTTILDLGEFAFVSTLNPAAAEFQPSYYPIEDQSDEARRVDDILRMVHHLVGVSDDEQLGYAAAFADMDELDEVTETYLDHEDALVGGLHSRPQQPKGNTYGRKRSGGRGSRNSRERRSA
jgi:hypothetical protein